MLLSTFSEFVLEKEKSVICIIVSNKLDNF